MTFEQQARQFLDGYSQDNGDADMDFDATEEIPQYQPVNEMNGPELPEDFFDTPPLPKCRRFREKQLLPHGTTLNAETIPINSSDSEETPTKQTKAAAKKEAKKLRRAQALEASKTVIKNNGKAKA